MLLLLLFIFCHTACVTGYPVVFAGFFVIICILFFPNSLAGENKIVAVVKPEFKKYVKLIHLQEFLNKVKVLGSINNEIESSKLLEFICNSGTFDGFQLADLSYALGALSLTAFWACMIEKRVLNRFIIAIPARSLLLNTLRGIIVFVMRLHVEQTIYRDLRKLAQVTIILFLIVAVGNLTGLIPFAFSYTGHIGFTFFLSMTVFLAWALLGIIRLNIRFFALFIPHNCPLWLFPLMIVIEILSFAIRPFSLSIRLFANILSGHILLHLINDSEVKVRDIENNLGTLPPSMSILVGIIKFLVNVLETGVAILQAYILSILNCIYLYDSVFERRFELGH
jgi:F-type H+-transporting ATPase subunit a